MKMNGDINTQTLKSCCCGSYYNRHAMGHFLGCPVVLCVHLYDDQQGAEDTAEEELAPAYKKVEQQKADPKGEQRRKNHCGIVALPSGKFLRVRKVFARPESFCA